MPIGLRLPVACLWLPSHHHIQQCVTSLSESFFSASNCCQSGSVRSRGTRPRPDNIHVCITAYQSLWSNTSPYPDKMFSPFLGKSHIRVFQELVWSQHLSPTRTICLQLRATVSKLQEYSSASKPILPIGFNDFIFPVPSLLQCLVMSKPFH